MRLIYAYVYTTHKYIHTPISHLPQCYAFMAYCKCLIDISYFYQREHGIYCISHDSFIQKWNQILRKCFSKGNKFLKEI